MTARIFLTGGRFNIPAKAHLGGNQARRPEAEAEAEAEGARVLPCAEVDRANYNKSRICPASHIDNKNRCRRVGAKEHLY